MNSQDSSIHDHDLPSDKEEVQLDSTVREIGVARFLGRINSGMIDPTRGFQAIERLAQEERERPLMSKLSHLLLGRRDAFHRAR